jgi:AmpD protein
LSENCSERKTEEISLLVIHNISLPPGEYGGGYIEKLFTNNLDPNDHAYFSEIYDLKVSSHLLIERDGSLVQFVPFNKKAWHAGVSSFEGRENCNEFSIGIELEGTDDDTYTEDQYRALIDITKVLMLVFQDIKKENIVGHSDIAPGRKTDPGKAFDWHYYLSNLV